MPAPRRNGLGGRCPAPGKGRFSIKWRLFYAFVLFSLILLLLLWFFQTICLDPFYRRVKAASVRHTAEAIADNIDHENLQDLVDRLSEDNDLQISILTQNGQSLVMQTSVRTSQIQRLQPVDFSRYFSLAADSGGSYLEQVGFSPSSPDPGGVTPDPASFDPDQFAGRLPFSSRAIDDQVAYALLTETADQDLVMILARARLSPVSSTVSTLRLQLLIISGTMLLLSLLLALSQSRRIARPIEQLNEQSRSLACGNYAVHFAAGGYREITQLAATLNQMARDLEQVEQLRRDLIANVSHDLRTPLTMIGGYAEVMRDLPGENNAHNLQVIIDETQRLTGLVNDLLDLSKMQSGRQALACQPVNLSALLDEQLNRLRVLVSQSGYQIRAQIEPGLVVAADPRLIGQVLANLLGNAINYTGPDRTITVLATRQEASARVEIHDSGSGITAEHLEHIWERYYRGDTHHQRSVVGSGLGLAIVKQVLEQHEAAFGVSSRPEGGSIFWFALRLCS
jgi:signal transduction histidine kinase